MRMIQIAFIISWLSFAIYSVNGGEFSNEDDISAKQEKEI